MGFKNMDVHVLFFCCLLLTSFLYSSMAESTSHKAGEFSYEDDAENGPSHWGDLKPEWNICETGKRQSPVDIQIPGVTEKRRKPVPGDLTSKYKKASAVIKNEVYSGVTWQGDAGSIQISHREYKLLKCHWHTPSEHTMEGTRYDAELHVVHEDDQGRRVAVGILYKVGEEDPFLAQVLPKLGSDGASLGDVNPSLINGLEEPQYFRYEGSLTTPPCTEKVTWTIIDSVKTISKEQLKGLQKFIQLGQIKDARPIQDLNKRIILIYRKPRE